MNSHPPDRISLTVSPVQAQLGVALLVLGIAIVDVVTPVNFVVSATYPVAVAVCLWTRSLRYLWATAAAIVILSVAGYFLGPPPDPEIDRVAWINHLASVATTLVVASLVHNAICSHRAIDSQRSSHAAQNTVLEQLNQELNLREEEVIRQNEELQSQTEELERQTEELRITNEELASWERRLEQLLELARRLTADLSRNDVFTKLCESLQSLATSHASAILEQSGDELHVVCHHGMGPAGPAVKCIPFAESFASKIMSLGQTGYLEDIALRPDLQFLQPKAGDPLRAVLSTPLRVQGRTIGTIEAYSHTARSWSPAEVVMIESLALQASASLQSAELVEEIQRQRRRFETAFQSVPFGMLVADDPQGNRIRINPAAASMFHLPSDENISTSTPIGQRLARQVYRGDAPVPGKELPLARALRGEEVHSEEFDVRPSQGRPLTVLISAASIFDSSGQVSGAVAGFVDVTGNKAVQRELELRRREAEEASVRKTRFLAAVSHDIRTPANAINLMAEILRRVAGDPSRSAEIAETAQRLQANTHSLMELVGDVLDVARFDAGKIELIESEFSLGELVEQECRQLLPIARDKGLDVRVEPLARPIWLRTDRIKLGRILGNLIGNAIKFTESGCVKIGAAIETSPERKVVLSVEDTGVGIPPEQLSWIFDEFAQLHNPARDRMKGTGLGLAICNRLVELMGGVIVVTSQVGEGSRFNVVLPAKLLSLRSEPLPTTAPARAANEQRINLQARILLVEDHSTTRDGTSRLLRDQGATVVAAPDATTALRQLEEQRFDLVLLDMMLPDMDGREVLRTMERKRPPGLRGIVVLTGDVTLDRVSEIKQLGADALIEKPIDVDRLMQTLSTLLGADPDQPPS